MPLNRNIITDEDVAHYLAAQAGQGPLPRTLAGSAPGQNALNPPTADDYITKLIKYVPPEVVGAYLFLNTLITQNEAAGTTARAGWLLALLVVSVAAAALYASSVLGVVRPEQIAMTAIGTAVYIFAIGGWFATTTWYHPWYGTAVLPIFALAVAMLRLPPLPPEVDVRTVPGGAQPGGGS